MRSCYEQIGGVKHSSAFVSGWILVDSDSSNAIYWVTKHHYKSQEVGFHHTLLRHANEEVDYLEKQGMGRDVMYKR